MLNISEKYFFSIKNIKKTITKLQRSILQIKFLSFQEN